MTRDDIVAVMAKIPNLNDFGIGLFDHGQGLTADQKVETLRQNQEQLLASEEACTRACAWLATVEKIKTPKYSSYGLKHVAEKAVGYVTNGVFIAAAVHCGVPYRLWPGSPNVGFGISKKSWERAQKLVDPVDPHSVRVSHFSWAQSDYKRGRAYPARFFRGCAHAVVSRKSVMNIMNNYLCAENSAPR